MPVKNLIQRCTSKQLKKESENELKDVTLNSGPPTDGPMIVGLTLGRKKLLD